MITGTWRKIVVLSKQDKQEHTCWDPHWQMPRNQNHIGRYKMFNLWIASFTSTSLHYWWSMLNKIFLKSIYISAYQFIFIKKLDQRWWNKHMEALQKGIYLRLNGSCHSKLCDKLDILSLQCKKWHKDIQQQKYVVVMKTLPNTQMQSSIHYRYHLL